MEISDRYFNNIVKIEVPRDLGQLLDWAFETHLQLQGGVMEARGKVHLPLSLRSRILVHDHVSLGHTGVEREFAN